MIERFGNLKIWVRLVAAIGAMLLVAWAVMIAWAAFEQRRVAIKQARDMASSVHQMTMANLLFMKVTKTIKKRSLYFEQVRQSEAIKDLRVLRGPPVIHEMGDGDEIAMNPDALEKQVLADGKAVFEEVQDPAVGHVLRAVIPAVASKNYLGKNCMECHEEAKEGQILGAVSMKISLTEVDAAVHEAEAKLVFAALVISLPLLGFIYFFVGRVVTRPLSAMTDGLQDIARGSGDLTRRLPVHCRDEIGTASEAFNHMMEKLRTLIAGVNRTANDVSTSARALLATSERIAESSAAQTDKSMNAASAMEQMAASIGSVAASTNQVDHLSAESQSRTEAGTASMAALQERIQQVENAVSQITGKVENFVNQAASISRMTQEVKEIANQTNLLALNAAIEAARAGEHGRGFAVVADEVRKLAEKSAKSANEIDAITKALGSESDEVRAAIDQGLSVLSNSHESMLNVAAVLNEASDTVHRVAQGMSGIRNATDEQSATSTMVASTVESIAGLARDNMRIIDDMAAATRELTRLSEGLQSEMSHFKI